VRELFDADSCIISDTAHSGAICYPVNFFARRWEAAPPPNSLPPRTALNFDTALRQEIPSNELYNLK